MIYKFISSKSPSWFHSENQNYLHWHVFKQQQKPSPTPSDTWVNEISTNLSWRTWWGKWPSSHWAQNLVSKWALESQGLPRLSYRQHSLKGQIMWDKWETLRARSQHSSCCKAQGTVQGRKGQNDTLEYLANGEIGQVLKGVVVPAQWGKSFSLTS